MPADSAPSLLITPDLRRRLQQQYEESLRQSNQPQPDRALIHALLAECLRTDPGNILYLDAVLANLRKWTDRPRQKATGWLFGAIQWLFRRSDPSATAEVLSTEYSVPSTQYAVPSAADRLHASDVLARSPEILLDRHTEPAALRSLAVASAVCEFDEAELRYLYAAREAVPDDAETLRMLARSLTRQGRFDEAKGPWFAVAALAPDAEAEQALDDLRVHFRGEPGPARRPLPSHLSAEAQTAVNQAWSLQASGEFDAAQDKLLEAQSASGGDLTILQEREELQLARSMHRLEIARRRAAADPHPRAQSLVGQLETEHNRLEMDILHVRCERLPGDTQCRLELARRLKRAGNYSGAIQRLEEITLARSASEGGNADFPASYLELGESWQHLRQFAKALDYYRQATAAAESNSETAKLAHYRFGVLATATNDREGAKSHLAAVVATDPAFKDARERLDKLNST